MATVDFSALADADFRRIWFDGAERWGTAQADRYTDSLYTMMQRLAEMPDIMRVRTEFRSPVRIYPFRTHLIVYRERLPDGIDVIRILHGRQDVVSALNR